MRVAKNTGKTRSSLLIFDFDGTISDTFPLLVEINNRLHKKLGTDPINPMEEKELKDSPFEKWLKIIEVPFYKAPFFISTLKTEIRASISTAKPFEGLPQVLRQLKKNGCELGIVTTDTKEAVKKFLKTYNLEVFAFVESCNFFIGKTPVIKKLLRKKKFLLDHVLYFGDTKRDVQEAHKAGIEVAAVTWGYNSKKLLEGCKPDYILETPSAILDLPYITRSDIVG